MKYSCIFFFCILAVAFADPDDPKQKLKDIHDSCQSNPETKIDDATMEKLQKGEKVDDPKLGAHMLCMNVKSGLQKDNGDINAEEIRTHLSRHNHDEAKVNEIVTECGTRAAGSTAQDAALALTKCLGKHLGHGHGHDHHHH